MEHLYKALQYHVQTLNGLEEESARLLMQEASSDPNSKEQYQHSSQAIPTDQQNLIAGYCTNGAIERSEEPDADEPLLTLPESVALLKETNVDGCDEQESSIKDESTKSKSAAEKVNSQPNTTHLPHQLFVFPPAGLTTDREPERTPYLPELAANQFREVQQELHSLQPENPRESEVNYNQHLVNRNQLAAHAATGAGGPEEQSPNRQEDSGPRRNRDGPPHVALQMPFTSDLSVAPIRKQLPSVFEWFASLKGVICCLVAFGLIFGLGFFVGRDSVHPSNALGVTCRYGSANASEVCIQMLLLLGLTVSEAQSPIHCYFAYK